jgi:hypothetical protein
VDAEGNLYVADTLNFRVQIFDPTGVLVTTFGSQGSAPGQFLKVKGLPSTPSATCTPSTASSRWSRS